MQTSQGTFSANRRAGCRAAVRRGVGCLLFAFLGFFQLEGVLPDICDGDATASELLAFARNNASDLPNAVFDTARAEVTASDVSLGGPQIPSRDNAEIPVGQHGTHACHCVHAHSGALAAPQEESASVAIALTRIASAAVSAPASMSYQPPLRPPVA
jgi:hypothetical protein